MRKGNREKGKQVLIEGNCKEEIVRKGILKYMRERTGWRAVAVRKGNRQKKNYEEKNREERINRKKVVVKEGSREGR